MLRMLHEVWIAFLARVTVIRQRKSALSFTGRETRILDSRESVK
jgi:hypothetical protein